MTLQTHNAAEENNPQIPLSLLPKSWILSNLKTVLYDMANVGMYRKHLGLKVPSFTQGTSSHPSHVTPSKWFRAQHVEVKEFTAPLSWFTIVEIEKEIGREMEKYQELETVQYLPWKQAEPINCETGRCLTSSSIHLLERVTNKLNTVEVCYGLWGVYM